MVELSSFERRLQTKQWVVIDSSIILSSGVPAFKQYIQCVKYLAKANKMYHPCITKPIMGELLKALCQVTNINLAMSAFQFVRDLTNEFKHIPHMHLEESDVEFLAKNFSSIPYDDRLHIAHIIQANKKWAKDNGAPSSIRFATIDSRITNPDVIRYLSVRKGLEIVNPLSLSL